VVGLGFPRTVRHTADTLVAGGLMDLAKSSEAAQTARAHT
jgi:hypothetical protein